jgi:conjugative transposon TraM protein
MDKMSYYDQASLDSARFQELVRNDPNYMNYMLSDTDELIEEDSLPEDDASLNTSLYGKGSYNNSHTDKIYRKLEELDKEMNKPLTARGNEEGYEPYSRVTGNGRTTVNSADIDRLEQMMQMMNQSSEDDPELKQLNGMLENILDMQHPGRVQEKLRKTSEARRGRVFAVATKTKDNRISLLETPASDGGITNGFYSLDDGSQGNSVQNAVQAVVHETQTLVNGSTVKLRLINDIYINGIHIPKDNFLFGTAALNGERLNIKISSIRYKNALFPVELSVYDMDGLDGIYIPGAITRDVSKESADRSLQTIGLSSVDPSWQAQAAGAGIEAAKTLFSKKVKLVKVTVKAGYQVLLRDEKQKQDEQSN